MRQNMSLDTRVFKDFDAVHACMPGRPARRLPSPNSGLRLVPHVIELLFLRLLEGGLALLGFCRQRTSGPE
jgi:hypothetical protein